MFEYVWSIDLGRNRFSWIKGNLKHWKFIEYENTDYVYFRIYKLEFYKSKKKRRG